MHIITKARLFFCFIIFLIIASMVSLCYIEKYNEIFIGLIFISILILFCSAPVLYKSLFRNISSEVALSLAQEKHWNQDNISEEIKKEDILILKKFFSLIYKAYYKMECERFLFKGKVEGTSFCLFGISIIRSLNLEKSPDKIQPAFVLKTSPIKNFDNTILITPLKFYSKNNTENLPKVDIDTKNLFNVYAQKAQDISKYIDEEFLSALISYYNKIDTRMTLLLTPKNIFFIKPNHSTNSLWQYLFFVSFIFRSAKSIKEKYWREYNQILDILKVLNLLKKD